LLKKSEKLLPDAPPEDAEEMADLVQQLREAIARGEQDDICNVMDKLEDLVFYLEDA